MNKNDRELHQKLQIQLALSQLAALRRELRETLHAYEARLEIMLAEIANELAGLKKAKQLSREQLDHVRRVITLLQRRKLKPEKGRRKDLRKVEKLIVDLHGTRIG